MPFKHDVVTPRHQIELAFARDSAGRTYLDTQYVAYPFHICRPFYFPHNPPGMPSLYLQSCSGGVFQNDRLSTAIVAGEATQSHVTTSASTIVHSMKEGDAEQKVFIDAGAGSLVEYLPDPLILFPRSRLRSCLKIKAHHTATVVMCDSFLTHDPEGGNEIFDSLRSETLVEGAEGELLATDRFNLIGKVLLQRLPGITGNYTAQGTIMVIHRGDLTAELTLMLRRSLAEVPGIYAGASALPNQSGAWARLLAVDGAALKAGINAAWRAVRQHLTGKLPTLSRK